jgi:glyoxylase-like metal-dependent hydrolase (beta-lactamase superfamily II)
MPHGTIKIGQVEITALCDAATRFPRALPEAFPETPADAWDEFRPRYPEAFIGEDGWLFHVHCYLVRGGERTILVDTGIGPPATVAAGWAGTPGRLPEELAETGVRPDEVDTVVLTHLHLDHIGWGMRAPTGSQPGLSFPNARFVVQRKDWELFQDFGDEEDRAAFEQQVAPLDRLGVLDAIEGSRQLTPGLTVVPTPGHTPGHQCVLIESGGERALVSGDLTNHPAQVTEPRWPSGGDMDRARAAESRSAWLDRVESQDMTLSTAHYPMPFARLIREDGRRYVQGA